MYLRSVAAKNIFRLSSWELRALYLGDLISHSYSSKVMSIDAFGANCFTS
jgi:hypothetical protein